MLFITLLVFLRNQFQEEQHEIDLQVEEPVEGGNVSQLEREEERNPSQNEIPSIDNEREERREEPSLRQRNSQRGTEITLNIRTGERNHSLSIDIEHATVLQLKQKAFPREIAEGKVVRLIHRGQFMTDSHPLAVYQLEDGHTLHASIIQSSPSADPQGPFPQFPGNVTLVNGPWVFYALSGTALGMLWSLFVLRGDTFFDFTSVVLLGALSFLLLSSFASSVLQRL